MKYFLVWILMKSQMDRQKVMHEPTLPEYRCAQKRKWLVLTTLGFHCPHHGCVATGSEPTLSEIWKFSSTQNNRNKETLRDSIEETLLLLLLWNDRAYFSLLNYTQFAICHSEGLEVGNTCNNIICHWAWFSLDHRQFSTHLLTQLEMVCHSPSL